MLELNNQIGFIINIAMHNLMQTVHVVYWIYKITSSRSLQILTVKHLL